MMRRRCLLVLTLVLLCAFVPVVPARAAPAGAAQWFPETGHTLAYSFRAFYDAHGGLPLFGYPLTEVFVEDGRPVQYFERARLEWHADLGITQAGHLGRWAAAQAAQQPPFMPLSGMAVPPDVSWFSPTGHTLRGVFREYWNARGGLPVFGYPLSEEFVERNAEDGREYVVQYFERARFELHPDLPPAYRVSLGHLGRRYLAAHPAPDWAVAPVSDAGAAWAALRPTRVTIERIGVDTEVTAAGISSGEWDVPRYTAAHYWPIASYPGLAGNIVIAGHVGYRDIIFSRLPEVQTGDEVVVYSGSATRRYRVREILTLLPHDTWVLLPTRSETLTLITCVPVQAYTHRLVVRAEPIP